LARKTDIRLRRSNTANAIPTSGNLSEGELAMNTMDGALYFKKSDNTIITAHDNTILHIDSGNDRIGIGTTSPSSKLEVNGEIGITNFDALRLGVNHGNGATIAYASNGNLNINPRSSYSTIFQSGNVGIGTDSPSSRLHVKASNSGATAVANGTLIVEQGSAPSIQIISANTQTQSIKFGDPEDGDVGKINYSHATNHMAFNTNGSEAARFDSSGNFGIGTAAPNGSGSRKTLNIDNASNGSAIRLSQNDSGALFRYDTTNGLKVGTITEENLSLQTNDTTALTIDTSQNVGIGTTAPEEDLHVAGDIKLTGTLFNGTRDEYTNSNLIRLNQRYTGGAVSGTSYFEANEYQKVVTITPDGSSENYQVSGTYYVQSGGDIQEVHFVAGLRSGVLPDLTWSIYYDQSNNGTAYIEPFLWTKETTTAGFILGFKVLTGSIFGSVTADIDIIPRNANDKDNVSINTTVQSEQTTIDTGFTNQSFTLRKSVKNNLHGFGTNPASGYRVDVSGNLKATALYSDGYIYHTGDSDTYINYSTDNIILSAGGEVMHIKGSGRVGIGTSSPSEKLHITSGSTNSNTFALLDPGTTAGNYSAVKVGRTDGSGNIQVADAVSGGVPISGSPGILLGSNLANLPAVGIRTPNSSAGHIVFNPKGTEAVRITADGDVGIGTSSPTHNLHIQNSGAAAAIKLRRDDSAKEMLILVGSSYGYVQNTTGPLGLGGSNGDRDILIDTSGRVGIGLTVPDSKLHVEQDAVAISTTNLDNGTALGLQVTMPDAAISGTPGVGISLGMHGRGRSYLVNTHVGTNKDSSELSIYTETGGVISESLKVTHDGKLEVNEAFTIPNSIGSAGQILKVPSSGTELVWADDAGGGSATILTDTDSDTKIQVEESADEDIIRFDTAGSQRMAILANGNIGIGVTSPGGILDVNGTYGDLKVGDPSVGSRLTYYDTTRILLNSNDIMFYTNSLTERMRIKNDGNVGIGVTTPSATLDVKSIHEVAARVESNHNNGTYFKILNSDATTGRKAILDLAPANNITGAHIAAEAQEDFSTTDNRTADLYFSTRHDGTLSEKMRVTSDGKVGIGTTNPSQVLSVNGNIYSIGGFVNASGYQLNGTYIVDSSRNLVNIAAITTSGNVTIGGDLTVNGTQTVLNTSTLTVDDLNITVADGAADAAAANGAGLTVDGANATWTYSSGDDAWASNKHAQFYTGGGSGSLSVGRSSDQALRLYADDNYNRIFAYQDADSNTDHFFDLVRSFAGTGRADFRIMNGSTVHMLVDKNGNVGINNTNPAYKLDVGGNTRVGGSINCVSLLQSYSSTFNIKNIAQDQDLNLNVNDGGTDTTAIAIKGTTANVGIGNTSPKAKLQVEEYGIDTTETSTTATTQVAIHTFAAADFRSARFTIQITNSTDSTYHTSEILLVHDGTTAYITEFGEIHTGTAEEATFDADISSGNVRLLATPASTDAMEFKIVCHSVTV